MSMQRIRLIITLMTVSLIGLIAFQLYWINNAVKINEERFKVDVHEALNAVSHKLEQHEVLFIATQKFQGRHSDSTKIFVNVDSIKVVDLNAGSKPSSSFTFLEKRANQISSPYYTLDISGDSMRFEFKVDDNIQYKDLSAIDPGLSIEVRRFNTEIDSIEKPDIDIKRRVKFVERKTEMVSYVVNELISGNKTIRNRLNPALLDSLLNIEFESKGIDTDFEYAVSDQQQQTVAYASLASWPNTFFNTEFKVGLFPGDLVSDNSFLFVKFPQQESYLIKKIGITLASSVVLIGIIIFCFVYAIMTILRQKKLSEIKNDFINNMTHEFKTPISTVSLACEALSDDAISKEESFRKRYLGIIDEENKRLGQQVEKVLQMATLDKNEINMKLERLDLHAIINRSIDNIALQVEKSNGTISRALNASKHLVMADEIHITNIIDNLLDNANKYSPEEPEITVFTAMSKGYIAVSVKDNGVGMSKEAQQLVFDKFYRVPTGNVHDVKGFGLGLAYVKTMVEELGGYVEVESQQYKGSKFTIYLPYLNE